MNLDTLQQDIRYAFRTLRQDSGFFTAAVLIIGLGVGANTAMFSVANALLFRPLPFPGSDRLVWIANHTEGADLSSVTSRVANYLDWRAMNKSLESMAAYFAFFDYGTYNLVGSGEPDRLVGVGVSQDFLSFLGVNLQLGRNFDAEESRWNGTPAVILTHGLWERRFGADPDIVGRAITLNDRATTVVGVLPASFDFATVFTPGSHIDMLVPFPITPETDRWGNTLAVLGRLKPNVTIQQAQAEFDLLCPQIMRGHKNRWLFSAKLTRLQEHLTSRFRRSLLILLGAVGFVLLVACTNLSNLMLARAASRRKEMAVRSALGATRWRLASQMLTESLMLAFLGGLLGLGLAYGAIRALAAVQRVEIPLLRAVQIDPPALLFTILAAAITGVLFGLVPAFQGSRANEAEALKDTGRGLSEAKRTAWTRSALVVSEVAMACVLLVGAGLLIRSFLRVLQVDAGFEPDRAAAWRIETGGKYSGVQQTAFYDRLVRAIEALPGVDSAGVTDALPLSRDRTWDITVPGVLYPKDQVPTSHPRLIDWRYLKTMRIGLVAGRDFTARDATDSPKVLILNEKAARTLWPGMDPIGRMANINGDAWKVVGIVRNVRHQNLEEEGGLEMYLPLTQKGNNSVELVVRTKLPTAALVPSVRAALRSIDPALPTSEYRELGELIDQAVSPRRFMMLLLGSFALAALLLAAVGIYGVVSYTVTQRTPEIGIRMALGATAGGVQTQVLRHTLALAGTGVAIGIAAAWVLARLTASLLFQMQPEDPASFGLTVLVLLSVAVAAGYIPARRASRVDPMTALRSE